MPDTQRDLTVKAVKPEGIGQKRGHGTYGPLMALIEQAREEKKWLVVTYDGEHWFTPDKLIRMHDKGMFRWGASNWRLDDPQKEVDYLKYKVAEACKDLKDFETEVARWRRETMADPGDTCPCGMTFKAYKEEQAKWPNAFEYCPVRSDHNHKFFPPHNTDKDEDLG